MRPQCSCVRHVPGNPVGCPRPRSVIGCCPLLFTDGFFGWQNIDGINFLYVKRNGLFLVTTTRVRPQIPLGSGLLSLHHLALVPLWLFLLGSLAVQCIAIVHA